MDTEELSKEQLVLRAMRKTLANVVKDVTPLGGRPSPLQDSTIQEIKECFGLISEREKELAEKLGFGEAKPYYADGQQPNANIINFVKLSKK